MEKGLLIILSGPSGVGKGTVRSYLIKDPSLNLAFSVSCTTRNPRAGEVDGADYFFISKQEFLNKVSKGEFLEYTEFCGNMYGTLRTYVDKLRSEGKNVLVEIETNGAKQVLKSLNKEDEISIFLTCPSLEELEKRIRGRNSECECKIKERLEKAKEELKLASNYDFVVTNVVPQECAKEIKQIIENKLKLSK